MPPVLPASDFHAQHSPFGAYASFTVGRHGKRGGFGLERGGPADQDVYVALARPGEGVRALPFYMGEAAGWSVFGEREIERRMGWASDAWRAGELTFRLLTPFGPAPDPRTLDDQALRNLLCPAVLAEITVDNRQGAGDAFAFFGVGAPDPLRPLSDTTGGRLRGIASETRWGLAVPTDDSVRETLTGGIVEAVARAASGETPPLHRLGTRGGVLLRARPGERRTWTLALGFYRGGAVTSGIAASYLYARVFVDLEDALAHALGRAGEIKALAAARDAELDAAPLSDERRFLLAHATHSYHGATQLLHDEWGALPRVPFAGAGDSRRRPIWVVRAGERRTMNPFDLTVDHAFWETRFHAWTLRDALDLFADRYSYHDEVQDATDPKRPRFPGGISFTHDMGVANQFSPPGLSAGEQADRTDRFSFTTMEQLCNWCLCAALYALPGANRRPGDALWLAARRPVLHACLESLLNRDGPMGLRDGIATLDTTRCGARGQEITTYAALDAALGQARASGYLAVKTWAAYLALSRCLHVLGEHAHAALAEEQAARAAAAIAARWNGERNGFPAVFEDGEGCASRGLPLIEGLAFPYVLDDRDAVSDDGPYGELIGLLRRHLRSVLVPGVCVDSVSGGLRIFSTSENTGMSKIFLCQFVAETVLGVPLDASCDAAHARWQREGDARDFAFTDQVRSTDGRDLDARGSPRGVTAVLWLPAS